MKISHLQEGSEAGIPSPSQPAPKFGHSDVAIEETTVAGNVGGGAPSNMGMQRRGSMFQGIKTSSKYANSHKAGIYEDDLSEENLLAKQRQIELFKKAKLRDLGKRTTISDVLLKKQIEQAMLEKLAMMEEDDNDFWYHGPHAIAKHLHKIHNKHTITTEDVNQLWEGYPPACVSVINNKPFMEKPDVANILKAHKELIESGEPI